MEAATTKHADRREDANRTSPAGDLSYEQTRILPEAFAGLDTGKTLNILDAGPVDPRSIEFFRRFRCQLYVADLCDPALSVHRVDSAREFLGAASGVRFDVCFLWDYINYLDNRDFADFIAALSDHVHETTGLYAIGAYSNSVPLRAYRYSIADSDRITIRPSGAMVPHPRDRNDVLKAMRGYVVHRAALRRDNRLELLLRPARATWS